MYQLPYEATAFICVGLVMIAIACFALGYQAGDHSNQYVLRSIRSQLHMVQKQKRELGEWVRENWPNEYAAFRQGHTAGYQQGIDHMALMDEEDAA